MNEMSVYVREFGSLPFFINPREGFSLSHWCEEREEEGSVMTTTYFSKQESSVVNLIKNQ